MTTADDNGSVVIRLYTRPTDDVAVMVEKAAFCKHLAHVFQPLPTTMNSIHYKYNFIFSTVRIRISYRALPDASKYILTAIALLRISLT